MITTSAWNGNDYSVHPAVIGRRITVTADLHRVQVTCDGRLIADHERIWANHQTISDPEHVTAAPLQVTARIGWAKTARSSSTD